MEAYFRWYSNLLEVNFSAVSEKSVFTALEGMFSWRADIAPVAALEFSQRYHAVTFRCQYLKNTIKFLTVPFWSLILSQSCKWSLPLIAGSLLVMVRVSRSPSIALTQLPWSAGVVTVRTVSFAYCWRPLTRIPDFLCTMQYKLLFIAQLLFYYVG